MLTTNRHIVRVTIEEYSQNVQSVRKQDHILRLGEVVKSWDCASIYAHMKKGTFPKAMNLGEHSIGWRESQINDWISGKSS